MAARLCLQARGRALARLARETQGQSSQEVADRVVHQDHLFMAASRLSSTLATAFSPCMFSEAAPESRSGTPGSRMLAGCRIGWLRRATVFSKSPRSTAISLAVGSRDRTR